MEELPNTPPDSFEMTNQEWDTSFPPLDNVPAPSRTFTPPPRNPVETITTEQYQRLQEDNAALTATIQHLQQQVQLLTAMAHQQQSGSSNLPSQQSDSTHVNNNMSMDSALTHLSNDSE